MEDKYLSSRLADLARTSDNRDIFTFSDFLSPSDAALARGAAGRVPYAMWGGMDGCERVVVRFGDESRIGYTADYPIRVIRISPQNRKFSDDLTHRDFLGALMHLGFERSMIGDILIRENTAWVFALEKIAPIIADELTSVKHTSVVCELADGVPEEAALRREKERLNIPSVRLDAMIARLYHLARGKARDLFASQLVFVNGEVCMHESLQPKAGDVISVRGYGKFIFTGVEGETKKGRIVALAEVYK